MSNSIERTCVIPQIVHLKVRNFRALHELDLDLSPITVFLGPNGSGKSTIFDVFSFLSECFTVGLRKAWEKRNRFRELRTRGQYGPIVIEIKYKEGPKIPFITYHLEIDENSKGPVVVKESLHTKSRNSNRKSNLLDFKNGEGSVVSSSNSNLEDVVVHETLISPESLAVNSFGQLASYPKIGGLRNFILGWHISQLGADATRGNPESGAQEHLSTTGDNLPNVIQYLKEIHPDRLEYILKSLSQKVPRLEGVATELLKDGRLSLQIKDAPFERPILAKYASDGTLKLLAYMILLNDPELPRMIGVEEPENYLHPMLINGLAEEFRIASQRTQIFMITHSPILVNAMMPDEVYVLSRDERGFTRAIRSSQMNGIPELVSEGGKLGDLWMESYFNSGYPSSRDRIQRPDSFD